MRLRRRDSPHFWTWLGQQHVQEGRSAAGRPPIELVSLLTQEEVAFHEGREQELWDFLARAQTDDDPPVEIIR